MSPLARPTACSIRPSRRPASLLVLFGLAVALLSDVFSGASTLDVALVPAATADERPPASPEASEAARPAGAPTTTPPGPALPETTPPPAAVKVDRAELQRRIERWIEQLGAPDFGSRETATKELRAIGAVARGALEKAARRDDREVSRRAAALLAALPPLTHTVVDALGRPIPLAEVAWEIVSQPDPQRTANDEDEGRKAAAGGPPESIRHASTTSDEQGRVGMTPTPEGSIDRRCVAVVRHPDYGIARCPVDLHGPDKRLRLPLLPLGSDERRRAVEGTVMTSTGEPVPGAALHCIDVRTPGEGLIQPTHPLADVLTDEAGRFSFYLPHEPNRRQPGDWIPADSFYELTIDVPTSDAYFPAAGRFSNASPQRIELVRPTLRRRVHWEAPGGGRLEKPAELRNLSVRLQRMDGDRPRIIPLDARSLAAGRSIVAGTYVATYHVDGRAVEYEPLEVRADGPEELLFRLPSTTVFHGRLVRGTDDSPLPGGLVLGFDSTARQNLALLTAEEWSLLREAPAVPPLDHPAVKLLRRHYGVQGLVRAGDDGRFEIVQPPDRPFYGLVAFGEERVPFRVLPREKPKEAGGRVDVGDVPLFPAARVRIKPSSRGARLSVSPEWLVSDDDQPAWFDRWKAVQRRGSYEFEYVHWLELDAAQELYVPADLRLRLRFELPYHDERAAVTIDEPIQLASGRSKDLGEIDFPDALPVVVQVVDATGKPLEGAPVRRLVAGTQTWSVAHNTDRQGAVRFFVPPDSSGRFRILDLKGPFDSPQDVNLTVEFQVGREAPTKPLRIEVTDEQRTRIKAGR